MAETRQFIGDEIHMMASDIAILRNENELLKMTSERKAEENRILRADLVELRAKYEEKVAESSALYTLLQSAAQGIHHGLQKYMEQRTLRKEHVAQVEETPRPEPNAALRARQREYAKPLVEQTRVAPPTVRAPVALTPETHDPAPEFLRRPHGPTIRNDIVDPRIPGNEFRSDADDLRMVAEGVLRRRE
jgi:hypothetical protein